MENGKGEGDIVKVNLPNCLEEINEQKRELKNDVFDIVLDQLISVTNPDIVSIYIFIYQKRYLFLWNSKVYMGGRCYRQGAHPLQKKKEKKKEHFLLQNK